MKLSISNCPECGQPATGTLEAVQGVALLQGPDSKGSFEYVGETVIDWDSQQTVLDKNGRVTLSCDQHHEWKAMRDETTLEDVCCAGA